MAEMFASKSRRRNSLMRASNYDDNEEFEANSQQAVSFLLITPPLFIPPSLVSRISRIGIIMPEQAPTQYDA